MQPFEIVAWIVTVIAAVCGVTELLRRLPARIAVLFFLLVPVLLLPVWMGQDKAILFSFVKAFSVSLAAAFIAALKAMPPRLQRKAAFAGYLILALNILEAIVTEAGLYGLSPNVLAGGLLLVLLALPRMISVQPRDGRPQVHYALGSAWLAGYTLWNFSFVHSLGILGLGTVPFAIAHLGAPLLLMRGDSTRYMEARAYSLTLLMWLLLTASGTPLFVRAPGWFEPSLVPVLGSASLALTLLLTLHGVRRFTRGDGVHDGLGLVLSGAATLVAAVPVARVRASN